MTVLVEVKNVRGWIYPPTDGLFQLLYKAAALQAAHPKRFFVPVLVTRRVHYLTYRMAKHLGFFVITFDASVQPILPHWTAKLEHIHEIRDELGYILSQTDQAMPGITKRFDDVLPKEGISVARRWSEMGPNLAPHFGALRRSSLSGRDREAEMDQLYQDATSIVPPEKAWRTVSSI